MKATVKSLGWFILVIGVGGCAGATVNDKTTNGNGGTGGGGQSGTVTLPGGGTVLPTGPILEDAPEPCEDPNACLDFPAEPILDKGVAANAPNQFNGSPTGAGPCILEPENGAVFPYNWLRPRIRWSGTSGLTQITITTPKEKHPLVIYTNGNSWDSWTNPQDPKGGIWKKLAAHIRDQDITVVVRPASGGASTIKFKIAPAGASGSIVFWAADPMTIGKLPEQALDNDSMLKGFSVGEEGTVDALVLSQVKQPSREQSYNKRTPKCMGCHVATPDPGFVAFVDHWPWNTVIAGIKSDNVGNMLPNMTAGGLSTLNKPWSGMPAFSKSFWQPGNRIMVSTSAQSSDTEPWSTDAKRPAKLVWFNLDSPDPLQQTQNTFLAELGKNYGVITRTGDDKGVAFPTWSSDGSTIVYCSTNGGNQDGRLEKGATDLYSVPFNSGTGGAAKPIPGASEAAYEEYYPAFSPDAKFLLFNRVPSGERMYANPKAEIFAIPAQGGTALKVAANNPPECSNHPSPGINNHFPRWAPAVKTFENKSYYWFIFSSNRMGLPTVSARTATGEMVKVEVSQLYLSLIVEEGGKLTSYPSIYLWNQSTSMVNTTPVWDVLEIPPAIIK